MAKKLVFDLPIIDKTEIWVSRDELAEFAARQMAIYYQDCIDTDEIANGCKLVITNKIFLRKAKDFFAHNCTLARQYKIQDGRFGFAGLMYEFSSDKLIITCSYHEKTHWYKKTKKLSYPDCHIRFYNQILFPLFSLYTIFDGYYLVHGSLIGYKNQKFIISGLDGVGKSSLSNLLAQSGAEIYSDNFVLFNGEKSVPFNLAIRLDPDKPTNMREIFRNHELKEVLSSSNTNQPISVDYIVVLSIGDTVELSKSGDNLTGLCLFSNNAPEICAANQIVAPFLYLHINKHCKTDIKIRKLSVPLGQIHKGMEVLINEN